MEKNINKILKVVIMLSIVFSGIVNTQAKNIGNQDNVSYQDIDNKSGGFVKSEVKVTKCTLSNTKVKYTDLVDSWAKTDTYTVTKTVTTSSSTTLSIGISNKIKDQLKAEFGITYGVSVSTSGSIGRTIKADPNRYSKLRHELQIKTYSIKVLIVDTYYDTSIGTYTRSNVYDGTISIPNKNESYIKVYYK